MWPVLRQLLTLSQDYILVFNLGWVVLGVEINVSVLFKIFLVSGGNILFVRIKARCPICVHTSL